MFLNFKVEKRYFNYLILQALNLKNQKKVILDLKLESGKYL